MKIVIPIALLAFAATSAQTVDEVSGPLAPVDPDDWLWLSCGKGKNGCGIQFDIQAQAKEKHDLRCCSDVAIPGWKKGSGCSNWHESDLIGLDGNVTCFHEVTYAEAQAICQANHDSYVCTKEQIERKCAKGSGCQHDKDFLWSSTGAPALAPPAVEPRDPDDWLYLSCGKGKDKCAIKGDIQAQAKEKHDLRCCTRKPREGWKRNNQCQIWHESDTLIGLNGTAACFHEVTYDEAQAICAANDARVCSKAEVDAGCAQGSGCGMDSQYLWTSTDSPPAPPLPGQETIPEEDYMFLGCGKGMAGCNGKPLGVAKANEKHELRCCSRFPKEGWKTSNGCANWHQSKLIGLDGVAGQCFHDVTYAEAQAICTANDAYVCTREEVINKCAQGSGCGHDADLIWSSNKANPSDVAAFVARQTQATELVGVCTEATGRVWGDPHFVTFDNLKYDCQGHGEFVIAMSKGNDPLAIHGRFVERRATSAKPTVTSSIAIKVLEEVPIVHVTVPDERDADGGCPFSFTMGKEEMPTEDIVQYYKDNYPDQVHVFTNGKNIIFTYPQQKARVQVTAGGRGRCVLNTNLCLTPENHGGAENIVGLLGSPTGSMDDDWMERDGGIRGLPDICTINNPTNQQKNMCKSALKREGHDWCMDNWCVGHSDNSLWSPETHALYNQCYDKTPDSFFDNLENPDPAVVAACKNTENPDECVTDTVAEIQEGGTLAEFVETLVNDEEEDKFVEHLGEGNAEEALVGWNGPVLSHTNAIAIELPTDFTPEDPVDFGAGVPVVTLNDIPEEQTAGTTQDANIPDPALPEIPEEHTAPAQTAGGRGDPHFRTWKGEHFEYHGQCDMILAKDPNFADGLGLEVQIRTKLVRYWSYIKRAAVRIGNDIIEIEGNADPTIRKIRYWFNLQRNGKTTDVGGFPLLIRADSTNKRTFEIDLSSKYPGQKIVVSTFHEFIRVDFKDGTAEAFGNTVGMLGDFKTGDLYSRDGKREITNFWELGNEWQLLPSDDMLFHDQAEPQFPRRCLMPEDPQGQRRRRLVESKITVAEAEAACSKSISDPLDIKDCMYDILATQNLDMVGAF